MVSVTDGIRPSWAYPVDTSDEIEMLKEEANYMQKSLDAINKRIDELEKEPAEES